MSNVSLPSDPSATRSRDGRWFGAGRSVAADAFTAGAEAVAAAVAGRPGAGLLLVFARDCVDMPPLLDGVRSQSGGNAKIAGCSTIEPMAASDGPAAFAVSVVAFGGDGFGYEIDLASDVEGKERAAGSLAASGLARLDHAHKVDSLVAGGTESCQQAVNTLGGATPIGLLTFDCAVRRRELGPVGVRREFDEIERIFPGVPFGGFYSYGEIARYRGATGMHHLTMVSLALA